MISGGNVYVPSEQPQTVWSPKTALWKTVSIHASISLAAFTVGTAVMAAVQEQDTTLIDESQKNLKAAQDFPKIIQKCRII